MRPKKISKFDFDEIQKLKNLFIEKGWNQFDEFDSFFNNYCSMLENLNPKQSSLVLDLTKKFIWLRSVDYYSYLKETLLQLKQFEYLSLDCIHVIPLISKTDRELQKIKSSSYVAYLCKNSEFKYNEFFKDTKFIVHNNLETMPKPSTLKKKNHPILLIDDFIGTGDTANEALDELLEKRDYDTETLFVATLVCQEEGKKIINDRGFYVLSPIIRNRGISENYEEVDVEDMKNLMREIEQILEQDTKFDTNYKFGYKESEALVALIRTPNNTFPIYWYSAKIGGGKQWMAPFPRD